MPKKEPSATVGSWLDDVFPDFESVSPKDAVPGFTISRDELYVLMKHSYKTARSIDFDDFLVDYTISKRRLQSTCAWGRFSAMAKILGSEAEAQAAAEIDEDFRDKHPYFWRAFLMGIPIRRGRNGFPLPEEHQLPLWAATTPEA
jgi:hypothetical protein